VSLAPAKEANREAALFVGNLGPDLRGLRWYGTIANDNNDNNRDDNNNNDNNCPTEPRAPGRPRRSLLD
jgi:hypothetical protein